MSKEIKKKTWILQKNFPAFAPKISEAVKERSSDNAKLFKKACSAAAAGKATSPTTSSTSNAVDDEFDAKDDRRKRAVAGRGSNKSGGGTAREIKTKSTKGKKGGRRGGGGGDDDDDDDFSKGGSGGGGREVHLELMSTDEMAQFLVDTFEGLPESLASEMAEELERPVNRKYTEEGESLGR